MIPYLVLVFFPIAFYVFCNSAKKGEKINSNEKLKKFFLFTCGLALFILVAFRSKYIGSNDSFNYFNNWILLRGIPAESIITFIKNSPMESGYLFTIWLLSHITPHPQFLFVYSGLLFSISVCRFIYKNCEDVLIGFFMFVTLGTYTFMVQGLRQAIAMSICLFAIEFVKKRKFLPFLVVVFFASFYHKSAIFFVIVYFLQYIPLNIKGFCGAAIASLILFIIAPWGVDFINKQFNREYEGVVERGGFIATTIYIIILLVAIFFGREKKKDKNFTLFFYLTMLGLMTYIMRFTSVVIAERISYYFAFGQIVVLPSVIQNFPTGERVPTKIVLILLCVCLFIYRLPPTGLAPYYFFWQL